MGGVEVEAVEAEGPFVLDLEILIKDG